LLVLASLNIGELASSQQFAQSLQLDLTSDAFEKNLEIGLAATDLRETLPYGLCFVQVLLKQ
jgi:hypothetical protein